MEIDTPYDSDLENNFRLNNDAWVSDPRWDTTIQKNYNWSILVPDGVIEYGFWVRNHGNMPTQVTFTDTMPAGTSFLAMFVRNGQNWNPVSPLLSNGQVIFDFGVMDPGQWFDFSIQLEIDSAVNPGTVLTNCANITLHPNDTWPFDNEACHEETVQPEGPNLRLIKYNWWDGTERIGYWLAVENLGTTVEYDIGITDTFPVSTTFGGEWWTDTWREVIIDDSVPGQLSWVFPELWPGERAGIGFFVDLPGPLIGVGGHTFGNFAWIAIPSGEVNPGDNSDYVETYSGSDIYIDKWLSAGEPLPGEHIYFTVEFGNLSEHPWHAFNTFITDTLPAGMTFVSATAPWDHNDTWTPAIVGNQLIWEWGFLGQREWYQFVIEVAVDLDVPLGSVLANKIEMYSNAPGTVEVSYDNNTDTVELQIGEKVLIFSPIINRGP